MGRRWRTKDMEIALYEWSKEEHEVSVSKGNGRSDASTGLSNYILKICFSQTNEDK